MVSLVDVTVAMRGDSTNLQSELRQAGAATRKFESETRSVAQGTRRASTQTDRFEADVRRLTTSLAQAAQRLGEVTGEAGKAGRGLRNLGYRAQGASNDFGTLAKAALAFFGVTQATVLAQRAVAGLFRGTLALDEANVNLGNRLRVVTETERDAAEVRRELVDISLRLRSSVEDVGAIFGRLAFSLDEPNDELLQLTDTLVRAGVAGGSSVQELNAGLVQLAQGFASNRFQGDELRSVLENLPGVTRVLLTGLQELSETGRINFTVEGIGDIRRAAEEGRLTADVLVDAFEAGRAEALRLSEEISYSITQNFAATKTAFLELASTLEEQTGFFESIADRILNANLALTEYARNRAAAFDEEQEILRLYQEQVLAHQQDAQVLGDVAANAQSVGDNLRRGLLGDQSPGVSLRRAFDDFIAPRRQEVAGVTFPRESWRQVFQGFNEELLARQPGVRLSEVIRDGVENSGSILESAGDRVSRALVSAEHFTRHDLYEGIPAAIAETVENAGNVLSAAGEQASRLLVRGIEAEQALDAAVRDTIVDGLQARDDLTLAGRLIGSQIATGVQASGSEITGALDDYLSPRIAAGGTILNAGRQIGEALVAGAQDAGTEIVDDVTAAVNRRAEDVGSITAAGQQVGEALVEGISDGSETIGNVLNSRIEAGLDTGGTVLAAGQQVGSALVQGVQESSREIVDALEDPVAEGIAEAERLAGTFYERVIVSPLFSADAPVARGGAAIGAAFRNAYDFLIADADFGESFRELGAQVADNFSDGLDEGLADAESTEAFRDLGRQINAVYGSLQATPLPVRTLGDELDRIQSPDVLRGLTTATRSVQTLGDELNRAYGPGLVDSLVQAEAAAVAVGDGLVGPSLTQLIEDTYGVSLVSNLQAAAEEASNVGTSLSGADQGLARVLEGGFAVSQALSGLRSRIGTAVGRGLTVDSTIQAAFSDSIEEALEDVDVSPLSDALGETATAFAGGIDSVLEETDLASRVTDARDAVRELSDELGALEVGVQLTPPSDDEVQEIITSIEEVAEIGLGRTTLDLVAANRATAASLLDDFRRNQRFRGGTITPLEGEEVRLRVTFAEDSVEAARQEIQAQLDSQPFQLTLRGFGTDIPRVTVPEGFVPDRRLSLEEANRLLAEARREYAEEGAANLRLHQELVAALSTSFLRPLQALAEAEPIDVEAGLRSGLDGVALAELVDYLQREPSVRERLSAEQDERIAEILANLDRSLEDFDPADAFPLPDAPGPSQTERLIAALEEARDAILALPEGQRLAEIERQRQRIDEITAPSTPLDAAQGTFDDLVDAENTLHANRVEQTRAWGQVIQTVLREASRGTDEWLRIAIRLIAVAIQQATALSSGGFLSGFGALFGGGLHAGGAVQPGVSYIVGEFGPERFVESRPGYILPNAGGTTVNVVNRFGPVGPGVSPAVIEEAANRGARQAVDATLELIRTPGTPMNVAVRTQVGA